MRIPFRTITTAAVLALTTAVLPGVGTHAVARPAAAPTLLSRSTAPYPFGASSVWRKDVTRLAVAARSRRQVAYLVGSITDRYGGVAAFNAYRYNSAVYVVPASAKRVDVRYSNCRRQASVPAGLTGRGGELTGVPIPARAAPAHGTDGTMSVYSPATDQLWELWKAHRSARGVWSACWGGRIDRVSHSPGYFGGGFGVAASGLSVTGGLVEYREVARGSIDHALSLQVPRTAVYRRFVYPAQRSDGWDRDPAALPEGTRLRLPASIDVSALPISRTAKVIARAAQRYGFIVTDTSGSVSVVAEALQPVTAAGPNWQKLLGGPTYDVLKGFPWARLQVLKPTR